MKALHFGAGNIGRGFIGKTLSQSGFNVIFSDIKQSIIDSINLYKEYSVNLVGKNSNNIIHVKNITALHCNDPKIINIISNVNLITTSVGANTLNDIAITIAKGILIRINNKSLEPMNIIACENKIKASSYLKNIVLKKLPIKHHDYINENIGFIDCSIDTIIPASNREKENNLFIVAENFKEWIVNVTQFKGKIPKIIDMKLSNNLDPFIDRKLFTLNTGHAVAAYLGLLKKYNTLKEAISDENIRNTVKNSMKESGAVLIKRYNFDVQNHLSYIKKIFLRFENPYLIDNLQRIARNPLQKLGKEERLIKPFIEAVKYQLPHVSLAKGIASVFYYKNLNDLESMKISSLIKQEGIQKTLSKICNFPLQSKEFHSIFSEYISMNK